MRRFGPPRHDTPLIGRFGAMPSSSSTPAVVDRLLRALRGEGVLPSAKAAVLAREHLCDSGFNALDGSACCAPRAGAYSATVGRSRAGSDSVPHARQTRVRDTRFITFLTSHPRFVRRCYPGRALCHPWALAVCGSYSRSRRASAAVGASSTRSVTVVPHLRPVGLCPSSTPSRDPAARPAPRVARNGLADMNVDVCRCAGSRHTVRPLPV